MSYTMYKRLSDVWFGMLRELSVYRIRNAVACRHSRSICVIWAVATVIVLAGACFAEDVQSASPLGAKDIGKAEAAVGDLVADAMRAALKTDVAFAAASEIKSKNDPFPPGKVSSADIAKLVSYPDDPLAVLEITGKAIRAALEKAVAIYPQPSLGFLQVSGLKFEFDPAKPVGERVHSVSIGGKPMDATARYTVAVTNSIANGALGYWKIWASQDVKSRQPDLTIVKALEAYFKSRAKIDYGTLGRIATASR